MTRFISPREDVKLLAASVPEDSYDFVIDHDNYLTWLVRKHKPELEYTHLPPGSYKRLGIATELPEEVTRELVERTGAVRYKDYDNQDGVFYTSNESWHSFLRREGITERVYVLKVK